jgi:hypothetical protein
MPEAVRRTIAFAIVDTKGREVLQDILRRREVFNLPLFLIPLPVTFSPIPLATPPSALVDLFRITAKQRPVVGWSTTGLLSAS